MTDHAHNGDSRTPICDGEFAGPAACVCGHPERHMTGAAVSDSDAAARVVIERAANGDLIVSDEGGEFARATTITSALHYASDLLHGPGTGPRGTVWNLMAAIERGESIKQPHEVIWAAQSMTELPCECENADRGFYTGRDGETHCAQCDGLAPGRTNAEE